MHCCLQNNLFVCWKQFLCLWISQKIIRCNVWTKYKMKGPHKLRVSVLRANEKGIFSHNPNGRYFILIVLGQERYLKIAEQCNSCWVVLKAVQKIYRRARSWTLGQLPIPHIINSTFSSVCAYNNIIYIYTFHYYY